MINLDDDVVNYMDSVCGGINGRSSFIDGLIRQFAQNQPQYVEPDQSYPEPEFTNVHRLHRGQFGYPQSPIRQRARSGVIRKPRQTVNLGRKGI